MEKRVQFSIFSTNLSTRNLGAIIRESFISDLKNGNKVIFDLSNIESISNSFADECFGKLLISYQVNDLKSITSFANTTPFIKDTILFALNIRLKDLVC
ncbi:STAS-like domain-containing protein [uncultured Acetobacteroides sp.]|uniref:STAS-like domain-containing protein n=1 Tax=uncultured Acetobacteroides sp. TaxID=1760811 RepID=UPI00374A2DBA